MGVVTTGQASAAGQATASGNAGLAQAATSAGMAQANVYGNAAQGIGNQLNTRANYDAYQNSMYGQQQNALYGGQGTGLNYGPRAGGGSNSIYTMTNPSM